MLKRVLITDKVHQLLPKGLEELGFFVDYDTAVDNNKLDEIIQNYDGIIINSKIILAKKAFYIVLFELLYRNYTYF